MQFNNSKIIFPNNFLINVPLNNTIELSQYNNIIKNGITIDSAVTINNNYYTIAYVDTNAFNSYEEPLFTNLNNSSLFIDKIKYFKYNITNHGSFENFINNLYLNHNVRLFLSSANSSDCINIFNFLNNHTDVIFISCTSTANLPNKPFNLLRLSLNDENIISNIIENIFPIFYMLRNIIDNNNINNNTTINKIYIIYTNDTYGISSKNIINNISSNISNITYEYYELNKDTNTNTIIYNLLNTNNNNNEVFFVYTLQPQIFLNFLDTQLMHNKFYLLGDTFIDKNLNSNLKLNNSYIIIGASDSYGHTISSTLLNSGSGASASNQQIDILIKFIFNCLPIIYNNLGNNLNNVINKLNELGIFNSGQWFEKNCGIYIIKQINPNNNNKYNLIYDYFININKFNPFTLILATADRRHMY
jgi:predicted phosphatase